MRTAAFFLLFCLLLSTPALAADTSSLEEALPQSAQEILGELTVDQARDGGLWQKIWSWTERELTGALVLAARSAGVALAVTLLGSMAASLTEDGKAPEYVLLGDRSWPRRSGRCWS